MYVVSAPEYCERILRWNWQNYARRGQVVKRIALLLGNGLIASNGEFWANQRRMIQPAFSRSSIGGLTKVIMSVNAELLDQWRLAAKRRKAVNVTHDVSFMVLTITLMAIFGDDYATVAPYFNVLAEESARNFEFAQTFRPLGKVILQIAAQRRRDSATATDFLGKMMQSRDRERGEPMPDAQLAREVLTLVVEFTSRPTSFNAARISGRYPITLIPIAWVQTTEWTGMNWRCARSAPAPGRASMVRGWWARVGIEPPASAV